MLSSLKYFYFLDLTFENMREMFFFGLYIFSQFFIQLHLNLSNEIDLLFLRSIHYFYRTILNFSYFFDVYWMHLQQIIFISTFYLHWISKVAAISFFFVHAWEFYYFVFSLRPDNLSSAYSIFFVFILFSAVFIVFSVIFFSWNSLNHQSLKNLLNHQARELSLILYLLLEDDTILLKLLFQKNHDQRLRQLSQQIQRAFPYPSNLLPFPL